MVLTRNSIKNNDIFRLKIKGRKKIYHDNINQKKARTSIQILK